MLLPGPPSLLGLLRWLAAVQVAAVDLDLVRLEERPPDGGVVAEVALHLLLQVQRSEGKIQTNIEAIIK